MTVWTLAEDIDSYVYEEVEGVTTSKAILKLPRKVLFANLLVFILSLMIGFYLVHRFIAFEEVPLDYNDDLELDLRNCRVKFEYHPELGKLYLNKYPARVKLRSWLAFKASSGLLPPRRKWIQIFDKSTDDTPIDSTNVTIGENELIIEHVSDVQSGEMKLTNGQGMGNNTRGSSRSNDTRGFSRSGSSELTHSGESEGKWLKDSTRLVKLVLPLWSYSQFLSSDVVVTVYDRDHFSFGNLRIKFRPDETPMEIDSHDVVLRARSEILMKGYHAQIIAPNLVSPEIKLSVTHGFIDLNIDAEDNSSLSIESSSAPVFITTSNRVECTMTPELARNALLRTVGGYIDLEETPEKTLTAKLGSTHGNTNRLKLNIVSNYCSVYITTTSTIEGAAIIDNAVDNCGSDMCPYVGNALNYDPDTIGTGSNRADQADSDQMLMGTWAGSNQMEAKYNSLGEEMFESFLKKISDDSAPDNIILDITVDRDGYGEQDHWYFVSQPTYLLKNWWHLLSSGGTSSPRALTANVHITGLYCTRQDIATNNEAYPNIEERNIPIPQTIVTNTAETAQGQWLNYGGFIDDTGPTTLCKRRIWVREYSKFNRMLRKHGIDNLKLLLDMHSKTENITNGTNGYGTNGYGTNGYGTNGYGTNGYGTNGYGTNDARDLLLRSSKGWFTQVVQLTEFSNLRENVITQAIDHTSTRSFRACCLLNLIVSLVLGYYIVKWFDTKCRESMMHNDMNDKRLNIEDSIRLQLCNELPGINIKCVRYESDECPAVRILWSEHIESKSYFVIVRCVDNNPNDRVKLISHGQDLYETDIPIWIESQPELLYTKGGIARNELLIPLKYPSAYAEKHFQIRSSQRWYINPQKSYRIILIWETPSISSNWSNTFMLNESWKYNNIPVKSFSRMLSSKDPNSLSLFLHHFTEIKPSINNTEFVFKNFQLVDYCPKSMGRNTCVRHVCATRVRALKFIIADRENEGDLSSLTSEMMTCEIYFGVDNLYAKTIAKYEPNIPCWKSFNFDHKDESSKVSNYGRQHDVLSRMLSLNRTSSGNVVKLSPADQNLIVSVELHSKVGGRQIARGSFDLTTLAPKITHLGSWAIVDIELTSNGIQQGYLRCQHDISYFQQYLVYPELRYGPPKASDSITTRSPMTARSHNDMGSYYVPPRQGYIQSQRAEFLCDMFYFIHDFPGQNIFEGSLISLDLVLPRSSESFVTDESLTVYVVEVFLRDKRGFQPTSFVLDKCTEYNFTVRDGYRSDGYRSDGLRYRSDGYRSDGYRSDGVRKPGGEFKAEKAGQSAAETSSGQQVDLMTVSWSVRYPWETRSTMRLSEKARHEAAINHGSATDGSATDGSATDGSATDGEKSSMSPDGFMRYVCFQAVLGSPNYDPDYVVATSNAFAIHKIITLQYLEFAYASFCRTCELEMKSIGPETLHVYGISTETRKVRICRGVRKKLPFELFSEENKGKENKGKENKGKENNIRKGSTYGNTNNLGGNTGRAWTDEVHEYTGLGNDEGGEIQNGRWEDGRWRNETKYKRGHIIVRHGHDGHGHDDGHDDGHGDDSLYVKCYGHYVVYPRSITVSIKGHKSIVKSEWEWIPVVPYLILKLDPSLWITSPLINLSLRCGLGMVYSYLYSSRESLALTLYNAETEKSIMVDIEEVWYMLPYNNSYFWRYQFIGIVIQSIRIAFNEWFNLVTDICMSCCVIYLGCWIESVPLSQYLFPDARLHHLPIYIQLPWLLTIITQILDLIHDSPSNFTIGPAWRSLWNCCRISRLTRLGILVVVTCGFIFWLLASILCWTDNNFPLLVVIGASGFLTYSINASFNESRIIVETFTRQHLNDLLLVALQNWFDKHTFGLDKHTFGLDKHTFGLDKHTFGLDKHTFGLDKHALGLDILTNKYSNTSTKVSQESPPSHSDFIHDEAVLALTEIPPHQNLTPWEQSFVVTRAQLRKRIVLGGKIVSWTCCLWFSADDDPMIVRSVSKTIFKVSGGFLDTLPFMGRLLAAQDVNTKITINEIVQILEQGNIKEALIDSATITVKHKRFRAIPITAPSATKRYKAAIVCLPLFPPSDKLTFSERISMIFCLFDDKQLGRWGPDEFQRWCTELKKPMLQHGGWPSVRKRLHTLYGMKIHPALGLTVHDLEMYYASVKSLDFDYTILFNGTSGNTSLTPVMDDAGNADGTDNKSAQEESDQEDRIERFVGGNWLGGGTDRVKTIDLVASRLQVMYNHITTRKRRTVLEELAAKSDSLIYELRDIQGDMLVPVLGKLRGREKAQTQTYRFVADCYAGMLVDAGNLAGQLVKVSSAIDVQASLSEFFDVVWPETCIRIAEGILTATNRSVLSADNVVENSRRAHVLDPHVILKVYDGLRPRLEHEFNLECKNLQPTSSSYKRKRVCALCRAFVLTHLIDEEECIGFEEVPDIDSSAIFDDDRLTPDCLDYYEPMNPELYDFFTEYINDQITGYAAIHDALLAILSSCLWKEVYLFYLKLIGLDPKTSHIYPLVRKQLSVEGLRGRRRRPSVGSSVLAGQGVGGRATSIDMVGGSMKYALNKHALDRYVLNYDAAVDVFRECSGNGCFLTVKLINEVVHKIIDNSIPTLAVYSCLESVGLDISIPFASNQSLLEVIDDVVFKRSARDSTDLYRLDVMMPLKNVFDTGMDITNAAQVNLEPGFVEFLQSVCKEGYITRSELLSACRYILENIVSVEQEKAVRLFRGVQTAPGFRVACVTFDMLHKALKDIGYTHSRLQSEIYWLAACRQISLNDRIEYMLPSSCFTELLMHATMQITLPNGVPWNWTKRTLMAETAIGVMSYNVFRRMVTDIGLEFDGESQLVLWKGLPKSYLDIGHYLGSVIGHRRASNRRPPGVQLVTPPDIPIEHQFVSIPWFYSEFPRVVMRGTWPRAIRHLAQQTLDRIQATKERVRVDRAVVDNAIRNSTNVFDQLGLIKYEKVPEILSNIYAKGMTEIELFECLKDMNLTIPTALVRKMFASMDVNNDRTLDMGEVLGGFEMLFVSLIPDLLSAAVGVTPQNNILSIVRAIGMLLIFFVFIALSASSFGVAGLDSNSNAMQSILAVAGAITLQASNARDPEDVKRLTMERMRLIMGPRFESMLDQARRLRLNWQPTGSEAR
ncbi:putative transmembrane protein [Gregarina niphandrodes]|uniref:Transmembrane protein n=1 Tax=Gregarina niphandrodes TaxID=110365 RepID=A0A023B5F3_GRENI|nr:putative transmembrane protein [Gregarina niphandrodes]EZG60235.1 putative transmembrane protein [Gregarina niphandrodes]|eukprot:XP_011130838.1 putative transmembrane protein [Gregarina niphandrodes]